MKIFFIFWINFLLILAGLSWITPSACSSYHTFPNPEHGFFDSTPENLADLSRSSHSEFSAASVNHLSYGRIPRVAYMTQPEKDEFYGREDELLQLSHWQRQYFYNRRRDLPGLVTLVCGQHGVGKTELVRRFVQLNPVSYTHLTLPTN